MKTDEGIPLSVAWERAAGERAAERFLHELQEIADGASISDTSIEVIRISFIAGWVRALVYAKARWTADLLEGKPSSKRNWRKDTVWHESGEGVKKALLKK